MVEDNGFLSRWSRRKVQAQEAEASPDQPSQAKVSAPVSAIEQSESMAPTVEAPPAPLPTLKDVDSLSHDSDFTRFVVPEVSGEVRNAALKKLFTDPHFNVMDGLDTYIDDYNTPDPLPPAMLKQMAQAVYLGLVDAESDKAAEPASDALLSSSPACANDHVSLAISHSAEPDAAPMKGPDEDADLRLQPHHEPGPPDALPGADGNTER